MPRTWPLLCAGMCSAVLAGQPPPAPPGPPPVTAPPVTAPPPSAPHAEPPVAPADEEFIEFLGADDVGDAAWWEFLKKSAPGKDPPKPATPPQDARS